MNKIDLADRTAVVTGGAQGIGGAVAARLADSGARVAIWDRDLPLARQTAQNLGRGAIAVEVDVADLDAVRRATVETISEFARVDCLVTSAGIAGPNAMLWDYPIEEWHRIHRVNVDGTYFCARELVPRMIENKYGRIVFVASIAGKEGNPTAGPYSCSKAAVIALAKSLGKELAGHDIAVNALTPAAARTRIFDQISQEHIDYMLSRIPRGRFLEVREAAAMVAWLLSAENSFTTASVFDLSGGRATY